MNPERDQRRRTLRGLRKGDPARQYGQQHYDSDDLRHRKWNDCPPPRNPAKVAAREGRHHENQATGRVLFPDNVIPIGEYTGRPLRQVPARELLRYAACSDLTANPKDPLCQRWAAVVDFVDRHRPDLEQRALNEATKKV